MRKLAFLLLLLLFFAAPASAQFQPTFVFEPNTPILASEVNANFTLLADALNRKGGTITGNISVDEDITIDGVDISDYLKSTGHVRTTTSGTAAAPSFTFANDTGTGIWFPANGTLAISLSGTERFRLSSSGLAVFGTNIINSSGKIPGFTSTYFSSLDGSQITNISESAITDGTIFARIGADETISGDWTFHSLTIEQTWDDAETVFTGLNFDITNTASASGSRVINAKVGGSSVFAVDAAGNVTATAFQMTTGASDGAVLTSDASGNASWQELPGGATGVPSGMVAMFEEACPSGWESRSGVGEPYENKFVRGGATYSETGGGSDTHTHSIDPPSTATTSAGAHTHTLDLPSTTTSSAGSHTHEITGSTGSTSIAHTHTYTTGGPSSTISATTGGGSVASSTHTHSGTTSSSGGSHSHSAGTLSASSAGAHTHSVDPAAVTTSSAGDHTHNIDITSFTSGSASNVPAYVQVVFCRKT